MANPEPATEYTFDFPEFKRSVKTTLPFTIEEIELFRQAHELLELLSAESSRGSGWQRNAFADYGLPWGTALRDRAQALKRVQKMKMFLRQIQDPRFSDHDDSDITKRPRDFSSAMLTILNQLPEE